jgi:hypothetical protein
VLAQARDRHATCSMTDAVWIEILRRTDIVRLATEHKVPSPDLVLRRDEKQDLLAPLSDLLAHALNEVLVAEEIPNCTTDGGELDRDTAGRVLYILRARRVRLERTPPLMNGDHGDAAQPVPGEVLDLGPDAPPRT